MTSDSPSPDGNQETADRLSRLETRLGEVENVLTTLVAAQTPLPPPPPPTAVPVGSPVPMPPPTPPKTRRVAPHLTVDIGSRPTITAEMALRWAGVVLVVFAALFFVSTAISRGWIGPTTQLALATLGGGILIGTGVHVERRWADSRRPWALALSNAGIVVLGLCAGAAHGWLDLVNVEVSTALIVAVLGLALGLADWFDHESQAISGLASALVVPGLIDAYDVFGDTGTGLWMLFLVAVTMVLAARYQWSVPRLLGLVVIGPLMVDLTEDFTDDGGGPVVWIQVMIAAAGLAWWLAPWLRPAGRRRRSLDHRLVFVVPGLVWMASIGLWATTDRERALIAMIVATAFGGVTAIIRFGGLPVPPLGIRLAFGHLVGVSALVSVGLALWFEGPVLLAALTVQTLGTVALASRADDRFLDVNAVLLGSIVGIWTAIGLLEGIDTGMTAAGAVVHLGVLVVAGVVAWLIRLRDPTVAGLIVVSAWIGLLAWVMAVLRPLPQGQMMVSITWAVLGVALVIVGLGALSFDQGVLSETLDRRRNEVKTAGLVTLAATVVKLVTVDLAEVDTIWRALLFAVVGVGLLRLGYSIGLLENGGKPDRNGTEPPGEPDADEPAPSL